MTSSFYQFCMRVQKMYAHIIRYVSKDGQGTYVFEYKNLVNAMLLLGDIKPGNKHADN